MDQFEQLAAVYYTDCWAFPDLDESIYPQSANALEPFDKIIQIRTDIRLRHCGQSVLIGKELQEILIRTIYGSNRIERAGLEWNATQYFCRQVFDQEQTGDWVYEGHDLSSKQETMARIYDVQPDAAHKNDLSNILLQARNEVIQHAKAYQHILEHFVVNQEDLSEELIKETHRILTCGVPLEDEGDEPKPGKFIDDEYGGLYRNVIVTAGTTCFAHPKGIPGLMTELCRDVKNDIQRAKDRGLMDAFSLAAKYSMAFVQIHSFRDGNGRMCRIILNVILCRFVGVFIPIGEDDEDIRTYIGIKRREGETLNGHGEYAAFVLKKAHARVRALKKKLPGRVS